MKKILIIATIFILSYFSLDYLYYYQGSIYLPHQGLVTSFAKSEDEKLWIDVGRGFEVFDIKGVNLGLGKPGHFATDHAITEEEYLRWFRQIQDLGANVIRIYTLTDEDFYEAFYEYNKDNPEPLYLIHGIEVDDYMLNSRRNAFEGDFYEDFLDNCKDVVDTIHGRNKTAKLNNAGSQVYKRDISSWVYGYILGVEWRGDIVAYTNETGPQLEKYQGRYMYTLGASNFEIFLAMIADTMIDYETRKYGTQRTLAFSNWAMTDPFEYPEKVALQYEKFSGIHVENIRSTEEFLSGQYASYHIYPYSPEFSSLMHENIENSFLYYLEKINEYHNLPVVVSEFGVPSSRGISAYEQNRTLGRDQGQLSETDQGHALVSLYQDIVKAGSSGAILFAWQDEWFKRTWNTLPFVNVEQIAYWSDYQTNTQSFGLLTFDPGKERSVVYVDGSKSEWKANDLVHESMGNRISVKYDEKFMYFLAEKEGFDADSDTLYIPIDLTPWSGSRNVEGKGVKATHSMDFLIEVRGKDESRILVQERYDMANAIFGKLLTQGYRAYEDPPEKNSPIFVPLLMVLQELDYYNLGVQVPFKDFDITRDGEYYTLSQSFESGKLKYGNATPTDADFDSLADFHFGEGFVEIKVPWQLLNFSDPTRMKIHNDYYEHFGVEEIEIDHLSIGVGDASATIQMRSFKLEKLGEDPEYHERLKKSYYILQDHWLRDQ